MRSAFRIIPASILGAALAFSASAQNINTYVGSDGVPVRVSAANPLPVTGGGGGGGSNASVGTTGTTAPTSGTLIGLQTAAGNLVPGCGATAGVLCSPIAGTSNRVITKTSVSANTNTTVCPTATVPVTTEILATSGSVGIGLNGQTLTTATIGTATTTPDMPLASANTYYLLPVAATNAITAYTGTAQIIVCIQTIRQ